MTARRKISPMQRLKVFEAASGRCHLCEQRIQVGDKWDVEHVRPLALGGADDQSNMRPAHKDCHKTKTKADAASWSKAKRVKAKHLGIKKPGGFRKPPPGFKYDWRVGRVVKEAR
jgi:5-methylcytosine-specific restriction endonuclease McrA